MAQTIKNLPAGRRPGFDPWIWKIPWRREWQPISVFWPGEFPGQRNLVGYTVHGVAESVTTEQLSLSEKAMGPNQTSKLLHCKGNNKQNKKTATNWEEILANDAPNKG